MADPVMLEYARILKEFEVETSQGRRVAMELARRRVERSETK